MAITGLGSKLSWGVETVWNTGVAATVAGQFMAESMQRSIDRIEPQTLSAGNRMVTSAGWRPGASMYEGSYEFQLLDTGLEEWLRLALGGYSFATGTHTFTPDEITKSFTTIVGMGGSTADAVKTYNGVVVDAWNIEATAGGTDAASLSFDAVGGAETVSSGAVAGSYPATVAPFTGFDVGTMTLAGATFECVKGIKISGSNNLKKDRFCLGQTGIADPRVETSRREYDCVLTVDFEDFTGTPAWYTQFTAGTEAALVVEFANGGKTLNITGNVRVDGETPTVDGTDIIEVDIPCKFVAATTDASGLTIAVTNGTTELPA